MQTKNTVLTNNFRVIVKLLTGTSRLTKGTVLIGSFQRGGASNRIFIPGGYPNTYGFSQESVETLRNGGTVRVLYDTGCAEFSKV